MTRKSASAYIRTSAYGMCSLPAYVTRLFGSAFYGSYQG